MTVIGITGNSFTEPYLLLSGRVGNSPGYFGERLVGARRSLVAAWDRRRKALKTGFKNTDIIGTFLLTSQVFAQDTCTSKRLIVLSDMRQHTAELDVETPTVISKRKIHGAANNALDLHGVQISVLGVDGYGKNSQYWLSLREFWLSILGSTGAAVDAFSPLRAIRLAPNTA